jgi:hypothetical protein
MTGAMDAVTGLEPACALAQPFVLFARPSPPRVLATTYSQKVTQDALLCAIR